MVLTNWIMAFIQADRREFDEARQRIEAFEALSLKANPNARNVIGTQRALLEAWTDVRQGRADAAAETLRRSEPLMAEIEPAGRSWLLFLRGLMTAEAALAAGRADEAIAAAEALVPPNLPTLRDSDVIGYNQPFVKDVLARAYWKKGDLDRAAAEYRKLLTIDPANQVRFLMSPLYHYRLGRVLDDKGDRAGARAEYAKFLEGWKDADPGHPELADARRRLAAR
jgi:tetratricopeptide (TPR) repeat protein